MMLAALNARPKTVCISRACGDKTREEDRTEQEWCLQEEKQSRNESQYPPTHTNAAILTPHYCCVGHRGRNTAISETWRAARNPARTDGPKLREAPCIGKEAAVARRVSGSLP